MRPVYLLLVTVIGIWIGSTATLAQPNDPPADKSGFSLLDPTPRWLMREFKTDRPDTTESAYTVDAGHLQIEASIVGHARDRSAGGRTRILELLPMNLKLGLSHRADLQLVVTPYEQIRTVSPSGRETDSGFGDTELRLKLNV